MMEVMIDDEWMIDDGVMIDEEGMTYDVGLIYDEVMIYDGGMIDDAWMIDHGEWSMMKVTKTKKNDNIHLGNSYNNGKIEGRIVQNAVILTKVGIAHVYKWTTQIYLRKDGH